MIMAYWIGILLPPKIRETGNLKVSFHDMYGILCCQSLQCVYIYIYILYIYIFKFIDIHQ